MVTLRFVFAVLALAAPLLTHAQVEAQLVSSVQVVEPGKPFLVALRLEHDAGWHTYWKNPGTGYPTSIEWELPSGWQASEIQWPVPSRIVDAAGEITGHGYDGVVLLPVMLTPPPEMGVDEPVRLSGRADWLACAESCVPGGAQLHLELPTGPKEAINGNQSASFQALSMPEPVRDGWSASAVREGSSITLRVHGAVGLAEVHFFPEDEVVLFDAPQSASDDGDGLVLTLALTPDEPVPERLKGVLAYRDSEAALRGIALDVDIAVAGPASTAGGSVDASFVATLGLALIGGLILNLMPCVFPVLGIKVLGFVRQAENNRREIVGHGLAFTIGVLASFWLLAGVLAVLRAGGAELGWGFQLQSPLFVFLLAGMLLAFALSLSGVFEFGLSATGVGAGLQTKTGFAGSFFSGVLATVVATPCSAPFLAPALGAALAMPIAQSFGIFTAIGIGLSVPALALCVYPQGAKLLPRPGAWMETFKQAMAFPLYGTCGYLIWVMAGQMDENSFLMALFGLTLIAMAAWSYGRFCTYAAKPKQRRNGWLATTAMLALGVGLGWPQSAGADSVQWEEWSPERVAELRREGVPVYIDFTARWCATCQANKKLVFTDEEVKEALRERGIRTLKADWTKRDARITAELAKWNRSAVPFNVYYGPSAAQPEILPELLTPEVVLKVIAN